MSIWCEEEDLDRVRLIGGLLERHATITLKAYPGETEPPAQYVYVVAPNDEQLFACVVEPDADIEEGFVSFVRDIFPRLSIPIIDVQLFEEATTPSV